MPNARGTKWVSRGSGPWRFQQQVPIPGWSQATRIQAAYRARLGRRAAIRVREFGRRYRAPWMK